MAEPYLQLRQSFLFNRLLDATQFRVAIALLGHVDPFAPLISVGIPLTTIAARANLSKAQICQSLKELELRCARCFAALGTCTCRSKKPMVQRLSSKGGHSSTKYKMHFAIAALQPIGQQEELSTTQTAAVHSVDSSSPQSGQQLSTDWTHLEIYRSEDNNKKIPLPPSGARAKKTDSPKKQKSPKPKEAEQAPAMPSPNDAPVLQAPTPASPWKLVVKLYHELLPELVPAEVIAGSKIDLDLRDRWAEHPTEEFWRGLFGRVAKSPILMGKAKTGFTWAASLPWLLMPGNLANVMGGKYAQGEVKHGDWRDNQPRQNTAMASGPEPGTNLLTLWSMQFLDEHQDEPRGGRAEQAHLAKMTAVWKARGSNQDDGDFTLDAHDAQ
jgi:hypothetical protein